MRWVQRRGPGVTNSNTTNKAEEEQNIDTGSEEQQQQQEEHDGPTSATDKRSGQQMEEERQEQTGETHTRNEQATYAKILKTPQKNISHEGGWGSDTRGSGEKQQAPTTTRTTSKIRDLQDRDTTLRVYQTYRSTTR